MKTIPHIINGKETVGESKEFSSVYNPATGEKTAKVVIGESNELNCAVNAAQKALPDWSNTTALRRARVLFKFKELIEKNIDILAHIITSEHGKILEDAKGEIIRGLEVVEFACGAPHLLKGEFSANVGSKVDSYSIRQPLGVCAGITPFNFPFMVPMWMIPIALACGNTFILKPAEQDPSVSIKIAELLSESGLPDGVFNVLHGRHDIVNGLIAHPDVKAISFVGSSPVAKHVHETGIKNAKRVQALGAAKNHCIVMPDADLDFVTDNIIGAAYGSAGERCMALSIAVTVGSKTSDALIEKLKIRAAHLKVAPGTETHADMGPLITKNHFEKVKSYIDSGVHERAELVLDGREIKVPGHENGYFIFPTLFDHVTPEMKIYQEEIFGPVFGIVRVNTFADALDLINMHKYGNGTAIFTNDGGTARTFASNVQVGMIGINVPIPVPMAFHSFGGWKDSIYGDYAMHGDEGFRFYTRLKTTTVKMAR